MVTLSLLNRPRLCGQHKKGPQVGKIKIYVNTAGGGDCGGQSVSATSAHTASNLMPSQR